MFLFMFKGVWYVFKGIFVNKKLEVRILFNDILFY